ncbi:hypothetical protein AcW1_007454 [Taiwanofungus camphoratus]|nr:hypothetical protein AcW2_007488 [Antrodia cinnamomea]KAI0953160.1 hypothetical protein AcW1_007454 [Antrodia cinnamomea]
MYPISDLTSFCRKTTGDVPPKLVGASTTVVGSKVYLYGGRLVAERRMVSDIYMFNLESFKWERLVQTAEEDIPQARYFHSADTWRNHLIIFGGMAIKPQSDNPEDLCVLNDVRLFDLTTKRWLSSSSTSGESSPASFIPNARYAHLSSVTADRLFIIGGQDLNNVWLDDVYIYDLLAKSWVQRRDYSRHCGTYRSVAVTAEMRVRLPQEEVGTSQSSSKLGPAGTRLRANASSTSNGTQPESLIHLAYAAPPTEEYPCDIFLFSNYNFTDVQRELEIFSPLSDNDFTVSDRSGAMTGSAFPPGLRFPTGAILGTHFIVAGTYLSQTYQSFSIWALDLVQMTWQRIDPGSPLANGSWFRSCLWPAANKFVVFGNRHGNLVEDYNRRLLSWDHVTCIDLEAFGIYQPPPLVLEIPAQEQGLAALEDGILADFEIICDDGRKVKCSRKLLEARWPWFKEHLSLFIRAAARTMETMPAIAQHLPLPELPGVSERQGLRLDPRFTPRSFHLSEPYPVTLALVQYFYTTALLTPLQHAPAVLSQLLLLATTYQLTHLQSLVTHAMHKALSSATSVGIYGVSTLCSCRSLQIRALRVVMAYSQKRPSGTRTRSDRDGPSGARHHDPSNGGGNNGPEGGGSADPSAAARPRGMSDASYLRGPSEGSGTSSNGVFRTASVKPPIKQSDSDVVTNRPTARARAMSDALLLSVSSASSSGGSDPAASGSPAQTRPVVSSAAKPKPNVIWLTRPVTTSSSQTRQPMALQIPSQERPLSPSTHEDICAIAAMMSPMSELADLSDEAERLHRQSPTDFNAHIHVADGGDPNQKLTAEFHLPSSSLPAPSSVCTDSSIYAGSDSDYVSDEFCDSATLSSGPAVFPAFHLPRTPQRTSNRDSDTPSLSSSTSHSSLSTPSLSRTSSTHRSVPVSPSSWSLATSVDVFPPGPLGPNHLDVISEGRTSEDQDLPHQFFDDEVTPPFTPAEPIEFNKEPYLLYESTTAEDIDIGGKFARDLDSSSTNPVSPQTAVPGTPLSRSDSPSLASQTRSPKSPHGGGAVLSRLFSKGEKKASKSEQDLRVHDLDASVSKLSLAKAEEKRKKVEAAKQWTAKSTPEKNRKASNRRHWDDSGMMSMFAGVAVRGGL